MGRHISRSSSRSSFDDSRSSDETKATGLTRPSANSSRSPQQYSPQYCDEPESYFDDRPIETDSPRPDRRVDEDADTFRRAPLSRAQTGNLNLRDNDDLASGFSMDPRNSDSTYASTDLSETLIDEDEEDDRDRYDTSHVNDDAYRYSDEYLESTADPSSPRQFAHLFPSNRQLLIRHDDQSKDGNVNIRVDNRWDHQDGETDRYVSDVLTLFHLKINDLKTGDFSLRRYCRDSGREICHYKRVAGDKKHHSTTTKSVRPGSNLQRSVSNVISSLKRGISGSSNKSLQDRHDSGYGSGSDGEDDERVVDRASTAMRSLAPIKPVKPLGKSGPPTRPGGQIELEFSNYQHLDIKRHSNTSDTKRRYTFEQWGTKFHWRRYLNHNKMLEDREEVTFHLIDTSRQGPSGKGIVVAKITPTHISIDEFYDEQDAQGWIQQSTLQIVDRYTIDKIKKDNSGLGDVIVATGLLALVDDTMLRKWHRKETRIHYVPGSKRNLQYELVNPRRFINEVFNRRESGERERFVEHHQQFQQSAQQQVQMQHKGPNGIATAARAILGGRRSLEQSAKEKGMERRVTEEVGRGRRRSRLSEESDGGGERAALDKAFVQRPTPLRKGQTYMY